MLLRDFWRDRSGAFNGSGTFNRLYNWVADKAASVKILAQRMDDEMDGFATGLSNCMTKDGQQTVTADIPMATHKFTGLSVGAAAGNSVRFEQFFAAETELTIASGVVTPTTPHHTVDTESDDASDLLDTITATNIPDGGLVWLRMANSARVVYVTAAGNVATPCRLRSDRPTGFILKGSTFYCIDQFVLLDIQTASASAALSFTKGIGSAYREVWFIGTDLVPATDNDNLTSKTSTDAGSNWDATTGDYDYAVHHLAAGSTIATTTSANAGDMVLAVGIGSDTGEGLSFRLVLSNPAGTALHKRAKWDGTYISNGATATQFWGGGARMAVADVDGMQFLFNGGNITSGNIIAIGVQ